MTIKEFYSYVPAASRSILKIISANLLNNKWSTISDADLTQLSNDVWFFNLNKELSPIIEDYCSLNNIDIPTMTTTNFQQICKWLYLKYQDKWTKLWDYIYLQTYNPIWNVDGTETIETWTEYGKTTTNTKDWSDTTTVTDETDESDVYGFDSATPVGDSKSTKNGETAVAHDGTDKYEDSGLDYHKEEKTRTGNIGVTMTQQLLESELAFRQKFIYFDIVIKDIISELAINIY